MRAASPPGALTCSGATTQAAMQIRARQSGGKGTDAPGTALAGPAAVLRLGMRAAHALQE